LQGGSSFLQLTVEINKTVRTIKLNLFITLFFCKQKEKLSQLRSKQKKVAKIDHFLPP
jgi:hypothetical protein